MDKKIIAVFVIAAVIFVSGCVQKTGPKQDVASLKKFSSVDEIKSFIQKNRADTGIGVSGAGFRATADAALPTLAAPSKAAVPDYSATNVQVQGVDEADIVKTDGKYIYTVSAGKNLSIVEAYPASNAKLLSVIEAGNSGSIYEMFVNKDRLIVFGREAVKKEPSPNLNESSDMIASKSSRVPYYPRTTYKAFVKVYDISDRSNPVMKRDLKLNGNYFDSRMIGNWVYFVVNNRVWGDNIELPLESSDVYYLDEPSNSYMLTLVGALDVEDDSQEVSSRTFLLAYTENMFVSLENIYITHQKIPSPKEQVDILVKDLLLPILPADIREQINRVYNSNKSNLAKQGELSLVLYNYSKTLSPNETIELQKKFVERLSIIAKKEQLTAVYKISINQGEIKLTAEGEFPGRLLNQFSMDEFNGNFRVATTTGNSWSRSSKNHVYVLDGDLKVIGKVEDLAPGESIFSARFLGNRAYLVTFKKVDPLFVIDLKDPTNPRVLGKLKIPGFSDYLHPYDENHIIGIGKEAVAAKEGDVAWFQGVKIALFDVSDPEKPKEVAKYVIGHRGTNSYALRDHKAFLFNKERGLLVIPVLLAEIDKDKYIGDVPARARGDYTFHGAYVFSPTLDKGFELRGRVTHVEDPETFEKSGYYYYGSGDLVKRSLFIGNVGEEVLYTISDKFVKANNLGDLSEVGVVKLPYEEPPPRYFID